MAEAGDSGWHGPGQRRRLESTLALIATAATAFSEREDGAKQVPLRDGRSIIARFDRDGWSVLSDAATSVLGYPIDIKLQTAPLSLVHPGDRSAALRAFASARNTPRATNPRDLRVRCANGEWKVLETVFLPTTTIPDLRAVIACAWDVTEQHAGQARLRQVVMKSDSAELVVDEHADLVLANDAFTRLFPMRAGRRTFADMDAALRAIASRCPDNESTYRQLTHLASRAHRWGEQLELIDGRVIDLDLVPLHDKHLALGAVWHFRDVTSAHFPERHEQDGDLHASLEKQTALLPTLSHELRTPLTALLSFVDLLADPRLGR
jgi:hypothetical protein